MKLQPWKIFDKVSDNCLMKETEIKDIKWLNSVFYFCNFDSFSLGIEGYLYCLRLFRTIFETYSFLFRDKINFNWLLSEYILWYSDFGVKNKKKTFKIKTKLSLEFFYNSNNLNTNKNELQQVCFCIVHFDIYGLSLTIFHSCHYKCTVFTICNFHIFISVCCSRRIDYLPKRWVWLENWISNQLVIGDSGGIFLYFSRTQ